MPAIDYTIRRGESITQYNSRISLSRAANTPPAPVSTPAKNQPTTLQQGQSYMGGTVQYDSATGRKLNTGESTYSSPIAPQLNSTPSNPETTMAGNVPPVNENPTIKIPDTIPSDVLSSGVTKSSVIQQAQSQQPTTISTISNLVGQVKYGETSDSVASLQKALIGAGYSIPALEKGTAKAGYYGDQTKTALAKYQKDQATIASGKLPDTSLSGIKKSLNDTLGELTKLKDLGASSIPDGVDPVTFLNETITKASGGGTQPPKLDFDPKSIGMGSDGLISLYTNYTNSQMDRQTKLDSLTKQLSEISAAGFNQKTALEYAPGITLSGLGGELRNLREKLGYQMSFVQPQIDTLTSQMNISKESFSTAVALAQQIDKMNQPEIISNSNGIFSIGADGTIKTLKEFPQTGGGGGTGGNIEYGAGNIASGAGINAPSNIDRATQTILASEKLTKVQRADVLNMLNTQGMDGAQRWWVANKFGVSEKEKYGQYANGAVILDNVTSQLENSTTEFGPYKSLLNSASPWLDIQRKPEYVELKQQIEFSQAQIRTGFYGTAITGTEQKNANNFLINNNDDTATVIRKTKGLAGLLKFTNDANSLRPLGVTVDINSYIPKPTTQSSGTATPSNSTSTYDKYTKPQPVTSPASGGGFWNGVVNVWRGLSGSIPPPM